MNNQIKLILAIIIIFVFIFGVVYIIGRVNTSKDTEAEEQEIGEVKGETNKKSFFRNLFKGDDKENIVHNNDGENFKNYITIEKLGVRFAIDDDAPNIVITNAPNDAYGIYLSTQNFIDTVEEEVRAENCGTKSIILYVFNNIEEIREYFILWSNMWPEDEQFFNEFDIHTLDDGRLWLHLDGNAQAVCYEADSNLEFVERAKITPYLEQLESIK